MADRLDIDFVRAQFPQLADGWGYFDNAGGTLVPKQFIARMTDYLTTSRVQPNGTYGPSAKATERLTEAKRAMAALINATPEEIVLGHSTTNNVFVLANAFRSRLKPGDEVIVTNLDHESNNGAWRRLADMGVVIKEWRMRPETADLELDDLKALLTDKTKLVCATNCSNVTGSENDAAAIAKLAHGAGALVCIDGVAHAPHRRIDVRATNVDFYLCSLYKIFGPHHGLMYVKREHMLSLKGQNHFFIAEDNLPLKMNVGGYDYETVASATGIADYFQALHAHHFPGANRPFGEQLDRVYDLMARHEEAVSKPLADFLSTHKRVKLVGRKSADRALRAPTFSFVVEGKNSGDVTKALDAQKLGLRHGTFYAHRAVDSLGYLPRGGVVRASLVHYNSAEDIRRLVDALDRVV